MWVKGFPSPRAFPVRASKRRITCERKRERGHSKSTVRMILKFYSKHGVFPSPFSSLLSRMAMVSLLSETLWAFRISALIPRNFGDDINRPS